MKSKIKILIAEDSATIQEAITSMLKNDPKFDFYISKVENGLDACKIDFKEQPDIILMDIEMPLMNGIKATYKIKSQKQINDIPIIVMSTSSFLKDAFTAGADDFIIKPFTEFELLLRLNVNIKLTQKSQELSYQNSILHNKMQEAEEQNEIIKHQQKEVLDDMTYASHIQNAINPNQEVLSELSKDFFVINRPKSVVGGDFYWAYKTEGRHYFAVGDCTGHGISGALMTMVGSAFLNEIVNNIPYISPGNILDELRHKVIDLLNQKGNVGEANNGMDIALCVFEPKTRRLEYAGANNPIYIARNNMELEVIKADRMPIGIYITHKTPFKSFETTLGLNDLLYMFTDGYPDQFGGPNGHKFRYKQFREIIISAAQNQMDKQHEIIDTNLIEWMQGYEQLDDILILGLKF